MSVTVAPFGRLLRTEAAATYLGIPRKKLYHLVARRKIRVLRDGRLGFYERWLDEWIVAHTTPEKGERPSQHIALPKVKVEAAGIQDLMPKRRRLSIAS